MKKFDSLETSEVKERLKTKFGGDQYATFFEVPDGTGTMKCRTADAVAMSLWPSRGLDLTGFEIKVSRGDWLKELKQPEKSHFFWQQCDFWVLVVGDKTIVKDGELPNGWGLMVPHGDGLRYKVKPERLAREEIDRGFLAGMLRAASKYCPPKEIEIKQKINEARDEGYQNGYRRGKQTTQHQTTLNESVSKSIEEINQRFGVQVLGNATFRIDEVFKAIRTIRNCDLSRLVEAIKLVESELPALSSLINSE